MSDCFPGTITFPAIAARHGIVREYLKDLPRGDAWENEDGTVTVCEPSASGGQPRIEATLVSLGIPCDRHSDAFHELNAQVRFFRPAHHRKPEVDTKIDSDQEGSLLVSLDVLRELAGPRGTVSLRKLASHLGLPEESVAECAQRCERQILRRMRKDGGFLDDEDVA